MRIILLVFLLIESIQAFSDPVGRDYVRYKSREMDSLLMVLQTAKDDTNKVNTLNYVSKQLWIKGDFNKSMQHANEAITLGKKINFDKGVADAYNNIGIINVEQANYTEALINYQIALKMREEMGDKRSSSDTYINIGNVYIEQGNYPQALKNYLVALKLGEEINNKGIIANAYGSIANVYSQQGYYEDALKNNFIALKLRESWNDVNGMLLCYINIGSIYAQQGNYAEALKNFFSSAELAEKLEDKRNMYSSYGNIGFVYMKQGNYAEALKYHLMALKTEEEMGAKYSIADTYINLGKIYGKTHKETEARDYLQKGLQLARENGTKDVIKDAYQALSQLDSLTGNMTAAYLHYRLYAEMKDSIMNNESNKQISQLKIQYESDNKDHQIKTQTLQNRILQTRIYYGITISFIIIGIILLLFYLRSRRKRREYEHTLVSLELTALKSQLNPHFISNSLIAIKAFIDKQPETASEFLLKFARLMRQVLMQSELPSVTLKEELETAELYMEIESLRLKYGFEYKIECDPLLDKKMIIVPPLILQPAIENAIRHGLSPKREKGYIHINVKAKDDLITFYVEDNGVGNKSVSEDNRPPGTKSFGLLITRKRIEVLNREFKNKGYMELKYLEGKTITEIAFPISYV